MKLFLVYYISAGRNHTEKEVSFFRQIQDALYEAYSKTETGMSVDYWNNNFRRYLSVAEAKTVLPNTAIQSPSVLFLYRESENEKFKSVYLKGVGSQAAWEKKFIEIFNFVPLEARQEQDNGTEGGESDSNGSNATGDKGDGNGSGSGSRPCNIVDEVLEGLGIKGLLKKLFYGAGSIYLGSRALQSPSKFGQLAQGGAAAYLAYLAFSDSDDCTKKKV
jgi:hypothetical protein